MVDSTSRFSFRNMQTGSWEIVAVLRTFITVIILIGLASSAQGGGVAGMVTNEKGEPLPYTTIFVKETGSGTVANGRGAYELLLPSGKYQITFQYLGYETVVH